MERMSGCGIVLGTSGDAAGYPCGRVASQYCADCGSEVCDLHAESCDLCHEIFCGPCCFFHLQERHAKPAVSSSFKEFEKDRSA